MGVLRSAFKMASAANKFVLMDRLKDWAWEKAEPKVSDFIRGIDFSTAVSGNAYVKNYDTAYTDEQKKDFEEKGRHIVELFENFGKYDKGERTIESAMIDAFSDIATAYKDDPGKVACWIEASTEESDAIFDVASRFNEKISEFESLGKEMTAESVGEFIKNDEELKQLITDIKNLPLRSKERSDDRESDKAGSKKQHTKNEEFDKSVNDSLYDTFKDVPIIGGFVEKYKSGTETQSEEQDGDRDVKRLKEEGLYMSEGEDTDSDLQSAQSADYSA